MEIQARRAIYVYYSNYKAARNLRKYGDMISSSKKFRYIKLYVNEEDLLSSITEIENLPYVKNVLVSYRPMLDMDFSKKEAKQQS